MNHIFYKDGYKYQLKKTFIINIPIFPDYPINSEFITLNTEGFLTIQSGYAWDGPSGPAIDTANFMRGSLIHDALYQLMREGHLDQDKYKPVADQVLKTICIDDGMSKIRAFFVHLAVKHFGETASDPMHKKPILVAPTKYKMPKRYNPTT
ncbi:conserved hypothetical protein [Desulfamplus magnetovallimortis]|uniref:DUF1353 domain-containing protein n=1 Tax=Desulfamplus magnetovallimortis TaxID=1246637 RepID=A0A1W1H5R8_9BACT|nr:hypothetical protein [Desulfamplus magnetovallimortis]SLM27823.1 conserved hypothetical protein [Desulfamplus magnetovallimortis]